MRNPQLEAACAATAFTIVTLATANANAQSFSWSAEPELNSVSDRRVVSFPKRYASGQIVVSFGDRRLYHVFNRGKAISYPIAVPRAQSRWRGVERVSHKKVNPTWTPTAEMRRENPKLPSVVAGGDPKNPLGNRAIYLGNTLYRIHGTDAPWTIGKNVSRGCIRMHNSHVAELYERVHTGMKVTATWKGFRARTLDNGRPTKTEDLHAMLGWTD